MNGHMKEFLMEQVPEIVRGDCRSWHNDNMFAVHRIAPIASLDVMMLVCASNRTGVNEGQALGRSRMRNAMLQGEYERRSYLVKNGSEREQKISRDSSAKSSAARLTEQSQSVRFLLTLCPHSPSSLETTRYTRLPHKPRSTYDSS